MLGRDDLNNYFPGSFDGPGSPNTYLPGPMPPPIRPDTSDGLSYFEGAWLYFLGRGDTIKIPFSTIDPGWGVNHFRGFDPCSQSEASTKKNYGDEYDLYTFKNMFSIAGPGRIWIQLNGTLSVTIDENCCKHWSYSGTISAAKNRFDFDPKPTWKERGFSKELITRIIHYLPFGTEFDMIFEGSRSVNESGDCPCP